MPVPLGAGDASPGVAPGLARSSGGDWCWLDEPRLWNGCGWNPEKCRTLRTVLAIPDLRFDSGELGGFLSLSAAEAGMAGVSGCFVAEVVLGLTMASFVRTKFCGFGGHCPSAFQPCTMAFVMSARFIGTVGVRPWMTTFE